MEPSGILTVQALCVSSWQQLEKIWSGARAKGGLKRERLIGPSPLTVKKNRSLRCSTRMRLRGVVFLLKIKRAIPFPRDSLHFVRLRSQPYTSSVTISGRTPQPRSHGPSFLLMPRSEYGEQ